MTDHPHNKEGTHMKKVLLTLGVLVAPLLAAPAAEAHTTWVKTRVQVEVSPPAPATQVEVQVSPPPPPAMTEDPTTWTIPDLPTCAETGDVEPCHWTGPTEPLPTLPFCHEVEGDVPCDWWTYLDNPPEEG